jgi:hypothetical protein
LENRKIAPPKKNADGSTTITGAREFKISDEKKLKFLYGLRNSFTHKGIPITNGEMGLFDDIMKIVDEKVHGYRKIHEEKVNNKVFFYSVSNWPTILVDIVKNYIANKELS